MVVRHKFGGGSTDWTFTWSGAGPYLTKDASQTVTFYDALSSGNQITDLVDTSGNPITSVDSDSNGQIPEFYGPAGLWTMAADANAGSGPRQWMTSVDSPSRANDFINGMVVSQVNSSGSYHAVPGCFALVTASSGTVNFYLPPMLTVPWGAKWVMRRTSATVVVHPASGEYINGLGSITWTTNGGIALFAGVPDGIAGPGWMGYR